MAVKVAFEAVDDSDILLPVFVPEPASGARYSGATPAPE